MASSDLANYIILKLRSYSCPCAHRGDIYTMRSKSFRTEFFFELKTTFFKFKISFTGILRMSIYRLLCGRTFSEKLSNIFDLL
jgi:hypothetical protein